MDDLWNSIFGNIGDIERRFDEMFAELSRGRGKTYGYIGIATSDKVQEEKTVEQLIQKADNSMYLVKAEGKGNYKFV